MAIPSFSAQLRVSFFLQFICSTYFKTDFLVCHRKVSTSLVKILVPHHHVDPTVNAEHKTTELFAHASLACSELLQTADPSAPSIKIVLQIVPALARNAKIHALDHADSMHFATYKTTNRSASASRVTRATLTLDAM
jgi:hypothetical protein